MGKLTRVGLGTAVVALVLAGCGGPGQVGSALIVGDQRVEVGAVQSTIDSALAHKADLAAQSSQQIADADIARYVVGGEVTHALLAQAAARTGVTASADAIDATLANTDDQSLLLDRTLFDGEELRSRAADHATAVALAERYVDGLSVTVDVAAATTADEAADKARALAEGGAAADAVLADPRTAQKGQVYRAAADPDTATTVVFGVPEGTVVRFQPSPGQGIWLVVKVTDRQTDAPSGVPPAAGTIDRGTLASIGERIAQADGGPVQLNPRFGAWDPTRLTVVPPGREAGSVLAPGA
ncbi:SurA N-terminal domain-containing protein [Pseudonocardia sp. WMMC193]|uniref:SurA N-terminal domain-containing protein n=1 Tax=Pseudonocardia sp. WMMC193 TaxID=2911965 RepID=UPI001F40AEAD|nr:SurA N-terminal domain-containing protein [Pseudonocardia sp. WMMC193]MCF7551268.1 SurA N-terminal domain-containing protein [Pseudonocardia sp. WMMC193]